LNKNIYILTLISGVFLPLNLIVGFFGMNTESLLFKDDPKGTLYVIYILIAIIFLFTMGLKILVLIDDFLTKTGMGKYQFYQKISNKIQDIDSPLKLE
jgi:hypothetical protein